MKILFIKLLLLLFCVSLHAQEFPNFHFENTQRNVNERFYRRQLPSLTPITFAPQSGNFNLPYVNIYADPHSKELNMAQIAQTRLLQKKQQTIDMEFPNRQLAQIRETTEVFFDPTNFSNRTNNNLNYYNKKTPDGGIKNEVYEDNRQPFINPFYRSYNSPYYYRRRSNSGSGFYFTR